MKPTILAVALLACTTANAAELAKWKHDGMTHVLTDEQGPCIKGAAVIRVDGPAPRTGCYTLDPNKVYIVWSDATDEKLSIRKFRPTRETVAAAEKERMDRDKDVVKRGLDANKDAATPRFEPPPPRPPRPPAGTPG